MVNPIGHEAAIPNPALKPLSFLVGEWSTEGSHPIADGGKRMVGQGELNRGDR